MLRSYAGPVTTPPSDPFGTPREGAATPSDRPSWDTSWTSGQEPQQGPSYGAPQQGQWYGQQPGQVQGGHAWQGPAQTESKAILALVCAIASWVVLPVLPAIAALMIGKTARQDIARSGGRLTGDGLVTAAKVVAWANLVATVLVVLFVVLAIALFAASASDFSVG